ncbi:hypothetical protein K227x_45510 [Rubripirellula lacrimiformis]|uniref:Uncharacterized protein n=1 Tax=Rubripirellula lacrimiformis TaxID=1930273 RepID=A0A517NGD9_9BACT|nr:hypothetical protein [Rubripirellula lacrimiformis]QDT06143.1 hypothetical protein K227x_45510 [Rubripirellula lacrimiformis]
MRATAADQATDDADAVAAFWHRMNQINGVDRVDAAADLQVRPPVVGLASSRLGHDVFRHRRMCRFLCRSVLDCRDLDGTLLIARGSAVEPWARRAADLFGVRHLVVSVDSGDLDSDIRLTAGDDQILSRDEILIQSADRLDVVHVRRGGKIHQLLCDRLDQHRDASTRVAIDAAGDRSVVELMDRGAIGWYLADPHPGANTTKVGKATTSHSSPQRKPPQPNRPAGEASTSNGVETRAALTHTDGAHTDGAHTDGAHTDGAHTDWTRIDGHWLVHCTRACQGPWPGETMDQYRDAMLLDGPAATRRAPADALERIIRTRRLVASAIATAKSDPVVCFSALPLAGLLARRCFRPHLGRWDYEPFGIAIRRWALQSLGAEPVIYGQPAERRTLPADQRYRFHPVGKTFDWPAEREWRVRGSVDLTALDTADVRVFAVAPPPPTLGTGTGDSHRFTRCPWEITWLEPPGNS